MLEDTIVERSHLAGVTIINRMRHGEAFVSSDEVLAKTGDLGKDDGSSKPLRGSKTKIVEINEKEPSPLDAFKQYSFSKKKFDQDAQSLGRLRCCCAPRCPDGRPPAPCPEPRRPGGAQGGIPLIT